MKTKKLSGWMLTPALFAGALAAQADQPQIEIAVDVDRCEMEIDVVLDADDDGLSDWICGVIVSPSDKRLPVFKALFPKLPPVLADAQVMAIGLGKDGRFQMEAPMSSQSDQDLFFQAIVMKPAGLEATAVIKVLPLSKHDAEVEEEEHEEDSRHDADDQDTPSHDADDEVTHSDSQERAGFEPAPQSPSDAKDCLDPDALDRLALTLLGTDSIPPWYSLQATYKAPVSGYHLSVQSIDRQGLADAEDGAGETVSVYLRLSRDDDESNAGETGHDDKGGSETIYAGAELGFGIAQVNVYFAQDCGAEPLEYALVRKFRTED